MQIERGLLDRIVLQRNRKNVSDADFAGTASTSGDVLARVIRGGKVVKGFNWTKVASSGGGKFTGTLKGLPAGGPYDVELRIGDGAEKAKIKAVLVGDVWICAGQSNMQGVGINIPPIKGDPRVRAFYVDDHWDTATEPMHALETAVDPVHNGGNRVTKPARNVRCLGPSIPFGQEMLRRTRVPQGLIACAHGGTSMSQWDPALKNQGGKSLYGATVRRLIKNGGKVAGVIWYQGESDANKDAAPLYTDRMKTLIAAFRADAADAALPIAVVQLSRVIAADDSWVSEWNSIQEQQRLLPTLVRNVTTVPAIDLAIDDTIHIGGPGQYILGRRLAQAMAVLKKLPGAGKPPIELRGVKANIDKVLGWVSLEVEFANVEGGLRSEGRPVGFSIGDPRPVATVFDATVRGNRVTVRTCSASDSVLGKSLHYGQGTDPVCNIVDAAGRSLPVFGPIHLKQTRAVTKHVRTFRVSPLLPGAGDLSDLSHPNGDAAALAPRQFVSDFASRHEELAGAGGDTLVYYAATIECAEPMDLRVLLGYDGPVKLWIDGKELFADPKGTNPAVADAKPIKWKAPAGRHEVLVALGSNQGRAWGIFLRFERPDVPKAVIAKGPEHYRMPRVIG